MAQHRSNSAQQKAHCFHCSEYYSVNKHHKELRSVKKNKHQLQFISAAIDRPSDLMWVSCSTLCVRRTSKLLVAYDTLSYLRRFAVIISHH